MSVFAHDCNDNAFEWRHPFLMSVWATNIGSKFHFRLCWWHMIASVWRLLHNSRYSVVSFCKVLCLYNTLSGFTELFQLHISIEFIVNRFNNAVRPTKEVCLNLKFFPTPVSFWRRLERVESKTCFRCQGATVWLSCVCEGASVINVVMLKPASFTQCCASCFIVPVGVLTLGTR